MYESVSGDQLSEQQYTHQGTTEGEYKYLRNRCSIVLLNVHVRFGRLLLGKASTTQMGRRIKIVVSPSMMRYTVLNG